MYQIRKGVFETNSSSTHSITFMSESEYDSWKNGEVYLNKVSPYDSSSKYVDKKFVTRDEATDILKQDKYYDDHFWDYIYNDANQSPEELDPEELNDEWLARCKIYTFKQYMWNDYLESDESSYITNSGEKIYAVCQYGND